MENLLNKQILLGVTGSVAAYKAAELLRLLSSAGAEVEVAMTAAATRFIGPATLQALSGHPVLTDMWTGPSPDGMDHIASVRRADVLLIAPATASTISRLVTGMADDPVAALASAATCPIVVAPAMNREMWASAALQRNLATLRQDGVVVIDPADGELACGEHGMGRLAEPERIIAEINQVLKLVQPEQQLLEGKAVAISTGATIEPIDAMRVLTNRSSGRMGAALASAAAAAGAAVHLLAGHTSVPLPTAMASVTEVGDTLSLRRASLRLAPRVDAYVSVAAVADYRARKPSKGKLARTNGTLQLDLVPTPDIIAEIAALRSKRPCCIAFAAEATSGAQGLKAARVKMKNKGVDAIVASPLAANLGGDNCKLTYIPRSGSATELGKTTKHLAAAKIIALLAKQLTKEAPC